MRQLLVENVLSVKSFSLIGIVASLNTSFPVNIVDLPLLIIIQNIKSMRNLLKPCFSLLVTRILVGMELFSQIIVGLLEGGLAESFTIHF